MTQTTVLPSSKRGWQAQRVRLITTHYVAQPEAFEVNWNCQISIRFCIFIMRASFNTSRLRPLRYVPFGAATPAWKHPCLKYVSWDLCEPYDPRDRYDTNRITHSTHITHVTHSDPNNIQPLPSPLRLLHSLDSPPSQLTVPLPTLPSPSQLTVSRLCPPPPNSPCLSRLSPSPSQLTVSLAALPSPSQLTVSLATPPSPSQLTVSLSTLPLPLPTHRVSRLSPPPPNSPCLSRLPPPPPNSPYLRDSPPSQLTVSLATLPPPPNSPYLSRLSPLPLPTHRVSRDFPSPSQLTVSLATLPSPSQLTVSLSTLPSPSQLTASLPSPSQLTVSPDSPPPNSPCLSRLSPSPPPPNSPYLSRLPPPLPTHRISRLPGVGELHPDVADGRRLDVVAVVEDVAVQFDASVGGPLIRREHSELGQETAQVVRHQKPGHVGHGRLLDTGLQRDCPGEGKKAGGGCQGSEPGGERAWQRVMCCRATAEIYQDITYEIHEIGDTWCGWALCICSSDRRLSRAISFSRNWLNEKTDPSVSLPVFLPESESLKCVDSAVMVRNISLASWTPHTHVWLDVVTFQLSLDILWQDNWPDSLNVLLPSKPIDHNPDYCPKHINPVLSSWHTEFCNRKK